MSDNKSSKLLNFQSSNDAKPSNPLLLMLYVSRFTFDVKTDSC